MNLRAKVEIAAMIAFCVVLWQVSRPKTESAGTITRAMIAPELKHADKQNITPPKVPVYTPSAKHKLQLPPDVQDDPNKYVLASNKLQNDIHTHTITTVINQQTGQVQTYDRRDPYPWLAAEQNGESGIYYGYKRGTKISRLTFSENLVQLSALHLGAHASLDTDGQFFAGIGIGWKW